MKRLLKISILFVLFTSQPGLIAQQWVKPKPLMTKNILKTFFETHLMYPIDAMKYKEEGTVVIAYSVNENGIIEERHILQAVSPSIDASALQLFDLILWNPATKYGKPVSCPASENSGFPIKYNIKKFNKLVKKRGYHFINPASLHVDESKKIYNVNQVEELPLFISDSIFSTDSEAVDNYNPKQQKSIRTPNINPSSTSALNQFIYSQITYPEEAIRLNISGVVRLAFVVEINGLLSNLVVKETVGGGCTEEAVSIVLKTKWIPGMKDGLIVRTLIELSIKFENPANLKNKHIPNQSNSGM
ncbi:MAG: hypothetical protein DRI89_08160 [Bacteroidetes bacterium]|nr:MAG: hypothetical protein DRI89_08160 [Bacteroidota bacterium]